MAIRFESQNVASAMAMISTLESGECQTLSGFTWEEYERLLEELGDGYARLVPRTPDDKLLFHFHSETLKFRTLFR